MPKLYFPAKNSLPWLLGLAIVGSSIAVIEQVHSYRKSFTESEALKQKRERLDHEWYKLLIEQQTFGATTQIGSRAVVSMGMYSPKAADIIILDVPSANTTSAP